MAELCKIKSGHADSNLGRMCRALVRRARNADVAACRLIFDRLEPTAQKVKGVDLGPKRPPARTITPETTPAEAARIYQEELRVPADWDDENDPIH